MVVGSVKLSNSSGVCSGCTSAQRNWDIWMRHLSECHPVPVEWLSEKALRLCGEAAHRPYTSITESKKKRKKDYIPRPLNSFMIFARHMRRSILDVFSEASNSDISKQLGEVWRTLSPSVKSQYNNEASKLSKIHLREFPNYKYQPKKKVKLAAPGVGQPSNQHQAQHLLHNHPQHHQIRYQPNLQQSHKVTKLSNSGLVSMIPLTIKTDGITIKRWTHHNSALQASSYATSVEADSPSSVPAPMMTSFANVAMQCADSDVAVGEAGIESSVPLTIASTSFSGQPHQSNYDYFAHLMDCSGLSGLNLETITFGDLPGSTFDDDDSEGSINIKSEDLYHTADDDFTLCSMKMDGTRYNSAQTPSSDISDDILNILPSSVLSSADEAVFGMDSGAYSSTDQPLPHLQSWAGLKL